MEKVQETAQTDADVVSMMAQLMKDNHELRAQVAAQERVIVKKGRGGGHPAVHCRDTKTGICYRTHGIAGNSVCHEFGLKPDEKGWVWYKVLEILEAPKHSVVQTRFVDIPNDEWEATVNAKRAKDETAALAKIAEEEKVRQAEIAKQLPTQKVDQKPAQNTNPAPKPNQNTNPAPKPNQNNNPTPKPQETAGKRS